VSVRSKFVEARLGEVGLFADRVEVITDMFDLVRTAEMMDVGRDPFARGQVVRGCVDGDSTDDQTDDGEDVADVT